MANRQDQLFFIFDMDGTLIDSNPTHQEAYTQFFKRYDINLTDEDFKEQISGRMNPDIMKHFFGDDIDQQRIDELAKEKEELYQQLFAPKIKPVEGLLNFLNSAHDTGIPMALATSASMMNVRFVYDHIPVESFFSQLVTDQDVAVGKPDPTVFRLAAERLGADPQRCVVFEDSPAGVEAGRSARMKVVALTTSHTREEREELDQADIVISNYTEISVEQVRQLFAPTAAVA